MKDNLENALNEFLGDVDEMTEEELNEEFNKFIEEYHNGILECENSNLYEAYELLACAIEAKTQKQTLKYAKEAYDKCPECFSALLFQAQLEENIFQAEEMLNDGLKKERDRLKKEGLFKKENIGHFYGILETRAYIRGLYQQMQYMILQGKIKKARDICIEIIKLNKNDNTGARYFLMAIYAYLEEEDNLINLYKKYPEEHLQVLFPLFALYFKLGEKEKAIGFLDRINKANPNFIKFCRGTMKKSEQIHEGYYTIGDPSEVIMYFLLYDFLISSLPSLRQFVLENIKKNKRK